MLTCGVLSWSELYKNGSLYYREFFLSYANNSIPNIQLKGYTYLESKEEEVCYSQAVESRKITYDAASNKIVLLYDQ